MGNHYHLCIETPEANLTALRSVHAQSIRLLQRMLQDTIYALPPGKCAKWLAPGSTLLCLCPVLLRPRHLSKLFLPSRPALHEMAQIKNQLFPLL